MRILYITPFVPWPIRVRSFNLIPRLARTHTIDLVCLAGSERDLTNLKMISPYCDSSSYVMHSKMKGVLRTASALISPVPLRLAYFASGAVQDKVRAAIAKNVPDLIYVERWRAWQFVPVDCDIPVVCDPTDSMTLYNKRLMTNGSWWERVIGFEEYVKFVKYEPKLARRIALTIFCSKVDRDTLLALDPGLRCAVVPNGVDCGRYYYKGSGKEDPSTIVFTGTFSYRPNLHAVVYLLNRIFPLIQSGCPNVKLLVVGNGAKQALHKYTRGIPNVEVKDLVPDLRPYLANATVAVAPLTVGVGVCNKVLEPLAVGTPVVASNMACGDLPVRDGEHLFLANEPKLFAERVLMLLRDPKLRAHMAERGRLLVEANYDWEVVTRKMEDLMCQFASNRSAVSRLSQLESRSFSTSI